MKFSINLGAGAAASAALLLLSSAAGQERGGATLAGRCEDDVAGESVVNARVTLASRSAGDAVTVFTDAYGAFRLEGLPAGTYQLRVDKAAFFTWTNDRIDVSGASPRSLGDIVLTAKREIGGTVMWTDGSPAQSASVSASLVVRGTRLVPVQPSQFAETNRLGRFLLSGLQPGKYVVQVTASRPANLGGATPGYYASSGLSSYDAAIDLRSARAASGVNILLAPTEAVAVAGRVKPSQAVPAGTHVEVGLLVPGDSAPMVSAEVTAGQEFGFPGVPYGKYFLFAVAGAEEGATQSRSLAVQSLTVLGEVRDVELAFAEPAEMAIKVELEQSERGAAAHPVPGFRLTFLSRTFGLLGAGMAATDERGEAHFAGALPNESYNLVFTLPAHTYLVGITQGGHERAGKPPTVEAGAGEIRMLLRGDACKVSGRVTGQGRKQATLVILAPKNRRRLREFRSVRPASDGNFSITDVAPGAYDVFAIESADVERFDDAAYLEAFVKAAVQVDVKPEAEAMVEVPITR